jgi:hypothetical protein
VSSRSGGRVFGVLRPLEAELPSELVAEGAVLGSQAGDSARAVSSRWRSEPGQNSDAVDRSGPLAGADWCFCSSRMARTRWRGADPQMPE